MAPERLTSSRARATALAVAFSVVAGGAALVAIPQIATAVEEGAADGAITTESTSIPVSGSGFTAGNVVYAQVKLPDGTMNWSWNSTPFTAAEDGTVTGELTSAEGFAAGVYEITLFESDDVSQAFTVEVVEADDTTTPTLTGEPSETPGETEPEQTPDETTPEETDDAEAGADGDEADSGVEGDDAGDDDSGAGDSSDAGVEGVTSPVENGDDQATGDDEATVVEPRAWAEQERYSAQEASGSGITYHLEGFTPGVELELVLTLPSGEQAEFSSNEPIVPDTDGTYVGTITYSGAWPAGDYSVTLRTVDGATIPVDLTPPAETDPAAPGDDEGETGEEGVVGDPDDGTDGVDGSVDGTDDGADGIDESDDGTGDETRTVDAALSAVQPAPVQEASFTFAVDGAQAGGGAGGGSDASNDGGLASTGGDFAFGAAGLGLLIVGSGAIVLIGGRFLGRRRDA